MARQPKIPDQADPAKKTESEFSSIDLEALIRFHVYVEDCKHSRVPLSIRAFMDGIGSHLTLLSNLNSIEAKAKQLVMVRAVLDDRNRKTGRHTDSYQEAELVHPKPKTRREPGIITEYGHAWADLGGYLYELINLMIDGGGDPTHLRTFIERQRAELMPLAVRVKHAKSMKLDDRK